MPYPSYNPYQNNYQFPNQNYFNQIPQFQQMPQGYNNQQENNLGGKIVDSIEVVKVTDVPMDGKFYYFPKADGTEIYTKRWLANGTTEILTFMKDNIVQENVQDNKINLEGMQSDIMQKLTSIDARMENLEIELGLNKKEG